jgi:hypothetical protein
MQTVNCVAPSPSSQALALEDLSGLFVLCIVFMSIAVVMFMLHKLEIVGKKAYERRMEAMRKKPDADAPSAIDLINPNIDYSVLRSIHWPGDYVEDSPQSRAVDAPSLEAEMLHQRYLSQNSSKPYLNIDSVLSSK